MWIWSKYAYGGYVKKLRAGYFTDPWVVHLGSLYLYFTGNEEEAITTVKVALSFRTTPLVVRTLAFLMGMNGGIEKVYDVYRRYLRKLFREGFTPETYQWELLFAGDLAFHLGLEERGWFFYKKYPKPHSDYMLRRKARLFFSSSPHDSKALYRVLYEEGKMLSTGDILRYAYLMGPREGRVFLNKMYADTGIKILSDAADGNFDDIPRYIDSLGNYPVFEGRFSRDSFQSSYVALSVEVLIHLLGTVYMPWSDMFFRRYGVFREKIRIEPALWDSGYSYEYHYGYLPPWWKLAVEYLENLWGVKMLLLSRRYGGKRRCMWGSRAKCSEIVERYDSIAKPVVEVE